MITATYPGTFDPLTNGHLDLIRRGLLDFSEAHRCSCRKQKETHALYFEERVQMAKEAVKGFSKR